MRVRWGDVIAQKGAHRARTVHPRPLGASLLFDNRVLMLLLHWGHGIFGFSPNFTKFQLLSPFFTPSLHVLLSISGGFLVVKGTAEHDGKEIWSLVQCWTDLVACQPCPCWLPKCAAPCAMHQQEALPAPVVARVFSQHVCPCLNWLEHDAIATWPTSSPLGGAPDAARTRRGDLAGWPYQAAVD